MLIRRCIITALAVFLATASGRAETLNEVIQSIYHRGVYFDTSRFTTPVLLDLANQAQELIATVAQSNEADTVIELGAAITYTLPADFYLVKAVLLNGSPQVDEGDPFNTEQALQYVPIEDYGSTARPQSGRPQAWSIWNGKIRLNRTTYTNADTITVCYIATPTAMADTGDSVDLPGGYLPLFREVLIQMCKDYITMTPASDQKALSLIAVVRDYIQGRPADEN